MNNHYDLTPQQIFNRVWDWFVVNKKPASLSEEGVCQYRGPNGARCAVGIFIHDKDYDRECEGGAISDLLTSYSIELRNFVRDHILLLEELQAVHDRAADGCSISEFSEAIKYGLIELAEEFELHIPQSTHEFIT